MHMSATRVKNPLMAIRRLTVIGPNLEACLFCAYSTSQYYLISPNLHRATRIEKRFLHREIPN